MQPDWSIRVLTMDDYEAVHDLWAGMDGIGLSAADSRQAIERFLNRNPDSSRVAVAGERVVGSALCGDDGRRGYLYHLVVAEDARGQSIATALVRACLEALARRHIEKCHAFVYADNDAGCGFWRHIGADERLELVVFSLMT